MGVEAMRIATALCGVAFMLALLPSKALAACDGAAALLKQAYPSATATEEGLAIKGDYPQSIRTDDVACKTWPANPALTLVAVPLIEVNDSDADESRGDVEIIIADTASRAPLARRLEKGMAFSDAVRFEGVKLDTARYDLKEGLRAFGIRTSQGGSSRVNPYSVEALWLYTFEAGHIERVLDGLVVLDDNGENNGDCEGTDTRIERTVTLGSIGAKGYRDLVVDQKVTLETSRNVSGECKSTDKPGAGKRIVIHFGDAGYGAPSKPATGLASGQRMLFSDIMQDAQSAEPASP